MARKEFIATASHELRTPIFSLGGFVELLQDEELDEETRREFLETMSEQVARLQKLSVDLLDLSRLDAGSVELHTEPVDLAELARSVAGEFRRPRRHGTELEVELPGRPVEARCDRERVAQIMRILLDNALRHTPEGTHVTVRAGRAQRLSRADRGRQRPGLPDGLRSRCSSASTPATRPAAPAWASRSRASWPSAWTASCALTSQPGGTAFTLELPAATDGTTTDEPRLTARGAWPRCAGRSLAAGCAATTSTRPAGSEPRSTTTRVQVVEGLGRAAASTRGRSTTASRRAW